MFKWIKGLFSKKTIAVDCESEIISNPDTSIDEMNDIVELDGIDNDNDDYINAVESVDSCKLFEHITIDESINIPSDLIEDTYADNCIKLYEVIKHPEEIVPKTLTWNTEHSYNFSNVAPDGYELFKKDRIVGCYYRKENIDEVINTFKINDNFIFELIIEDEPDNSYDSNAKKISLLYLINDETRKIQLGYLSRHSTDDLKYFTDIKIYLSRIENLDYQDTYMEIYLKSNDIINLHEIKKEIAKENKRIETENRMKEAQEKIAFETSQLAISLEKLGHIDEAIEKYKESIDLGFYAPNSFKRLSILYRKNKDYKSEIDTCKLAIKIFKEKQTTSDKLIYFEERLAKAILLDEKQNSREIKKDVHIKTMATNDTVNIDISKKVNEDDKMRTCTVCNVTKTIDDFEKNGTKSDGSPKYKYQCKDCRNKRKREIKHNK